MEPYRGACFVSSRAHLRGDQKCWRTASKIQGMGEKSDFLDKMLWVFKVSCCGENMKTKWKDKIAVKPLNGAFWNAVQQQNRPWSFSFYKVYIYHCPRYLNYHLMINRAACGYVHKGAAFLQKKQFSVAHRTNYKGVKWFIYAAMQIKIKILSGSRTRSARGHTNIFMSFWNILPSAVYDA